MRWLATLMLGTSLCTSANAGLITIDFTELAAQPVHGLTVKGVTFRYEIAGLPSADAIFGSTTPLGTTFIQSPFLEGNPLGVLTMDFSSAVESLAFGLAVIPSRAYFPGALVAVYDTSYNLGANIPVNLLDIGNGVAEGLFSFNGGPLGRAAVIFDPSATRFALDNIHITTVPEPNALLLTALPLLMIAVRSRKKA